MQIGSKCLFNKTRKHNEQYEHNYETEANNELI